MTHRILSCLIALTFVLSSTGPLTAALPPQQPSASPAAAAPTQAAMSQALRSSPIMFIENVGQFADGARFQVRGGNGTMWLAEDALWITVMEPGEAARPDRSPRADLLTTESLAVPEKLRTGVNIHLSFPGANAHPRIEPFDRLDTVVSYFLGNDPDRWRPDVPVWGGVRYVDLYPGVDLEIASRNGEVVKRLTARAGADLAAVQLRVEGPDAVTVDEDVLLLNTTAGEFALSLIETDGVWVAGLKVKPCGVQAFDVDAPFVSTKLNLESVIENPQSLAGLLYSTFLGGSGPETANALTVDAAGAVYVTGLTESNSFPTSPGGFDTTYSGFGDAFVAKLDPEGSRLAYATFLGGGDDFIRDYGGGIAVDELGSAHVTGYTGSSDFPFTADAFDISFNGGSYDAFVVKLNPSGRALVYATFLGGSGYDYGNGIAVDGTGSTYVAVMTGSRDFPTTVEAFDTGYNGGSDAFVVKLNPSGSGLAYATFLGGSGNDWVAEIVVDGTGNAYVTGGTGSADFPTTAGAFDTGFNGPYTGPYGDTFVAKLNSAGSGLIYATFLGGGGDDSCFSIAVDETNSAYVAGRTSSIDFPTTPDAYDTSFNGGDDDAFVAKLDPAGNRLAYSTFLGGSSTEEGRSISVDGSNSALVTGSTASSDFPSTPGTLDSTSSGYDAFVVKLNPNGSGPVYATFLGGSGHDYGYTIAVDEAGTAYMAGDTTSSDFPTTLGALDTSFNGGDDDAFVVKLALGGGATYSISGRVTDGTGNTIAGVTVSAGAAGSATTDQNGAYTLTGLAAGTYTLTPSKSGYSFSPASRTVTVPPDATGQNFVGSQQEARLRLLYVPLRWEGSQDSFDAEARTQSDIFIDGVPLRDCRDRVSVETLRVASQNFATFSCSASNCGVGSVRTFVSDTLHINPADYDVIVGLGETSPCAPIAGCSNGTDTIWVKEAYDSVTAHELGHIYGLADEYCSNQAGSTDSRCNDGDSQGDGSMTGDVNWLDASQPFDCPADGSTDSGGSACCNFGGYSCSAVNYGVCCLGNKNSAGGRSTMSYANAPEPRGFDSHDQAHLNALPALNCDGAATAASLAPAGLPEDAFQTVLDVHLRVYNSDSVERESIAIYPGRPTSSSVQQGMNGNYSLSIVNDAGNELWTRSFPLYFDYAGPTVLGTDYSGINYAAAAVEFRIPYQCGMKTLMVYHSGALVFSEELPAGCATPLPLNLLGSGSDRLLTWQHLAADIDHYEVHRSNIAYFSPDESSLLASAAVADDSTLEYLDTNQVGADAGLYYVVVPIGANGWRYPASTRVGIFNFALTSGTLP